MTVLESVRTVGKIRLRVGHEKPDWHRCGCRWKILQCDCSARHWSKTQDENIVNTNSGGMEGKKKRGRNENILPFHFKTDTFISWQLDEFDQRTLRFIKACQRQHLNTMGANILRKAFQVEFSPQIDETRFTDEHVLKRGRHAGIDSLTYRLPIG